MATKRKATPGGEPEAKRARQEEAIPVTETSNELTDTLDAVDGEGFVRLLRGADAQVYSGWRHHVGLSDTVVLDKMEAVSQRMAEMIRSPEDAAIVFTGCGTSGRLAFYAARTGNRTMREQGKPEIFKYCHGGGDAALLLSRELPEDSPSLGATDLKAAAGTARQVLLIGITCGLSAPYVAGQVEYGMQADNYTTVMVGFNPAELARDKVVEGWDRTVRDIVRDLQAREGDGKNFLINPVIGPEPVTGSSRMKGGTATKVILDSVMVAAFGSVAGQPCPAASMVDGCAFAYRQTYLSTLDIARLVDKAAASVCSGGRVFYIGEGPCGIMGLVDASEMVDTYGAHPSEIRSFVNDGWRTMGNQEGDLEHMAAHMTPEELLAADDDLALLKFSFDHFTSLILPSITERDTVVLMSIGALSERMENMRERIPQSCALVVALTASDTASKHDVCIDLTARNCAPSTLGQTCLAELAVKYSLNIITTGAQVRKGLVYHNHMVNMGVANNKLFFRAIGIVREYMHVSESEARRCLLRAIYSSVTLTEKQLAAPVSEHLIVATGKQMVLPQALLLASGKFSSVEAAQAALRATPVVRKVIAKVQTASR